MTKTSAKTSSPLDRLATLKGEEASRRAEARERNRREMPGVAWIFDEVRKVFPNAQMVHAEENGREIGKPPPLPPNCVEIDITHGSWMEEWAAMQRSKRK